MKLIVFLIEAGVGVLALWIFAKYVLYPILQYVQYQKKRMPKKKTKQDYEEELKTQKLKAELDRATFDRSEDLVDHLDSLFSEARRHQPRKTERE